MRRIIIVAFVLVAAAPASGQVYAPPPYIQPPKPMGIIEFLDEVGVERWKVKLSGEETYLRFTGSGCTMIGEVYRGMITPLYDNMTFKTTNGRECRVMAIER